MDKLFIVEGIPGSGKTTFAKALADQIQTNGDEVHLYVEGDLHPADMAWSALLTVGEYNLLCTSYPDLVGELERNKTVWKQYVIIAYTKIHNLEEKLFHYFESKEIYDARTDATLFCNIHKDRWKQFGLDATGIAIFECALLQNSINELLLFHCMEEEAVTDYIRHLVDAVKRLNPVIIYLEVDTKAAIERAARERLDSNGKRVWEHGITQYIENSPYGRKYGLHDIDGMYQYFETRKQLELRILDKLPIETHCISIDVTRQSEVVVKAIEELCHNNRV
ncbi:MAG: thymidylate kinase [bacterium]|nr:thymidylate kinase [bacterium]